MGISEKHHGIEGGGAVIEMEGNKKKRYVIVGVPVPIIRTPPPLRKIRTERVEIKIQSEVEVEDEEEECPTTPSSKEARLPKRTECPPAPRKKRPSASSRSCNFNVKDFFSPPDLDSVFIRHLESASAK
ncbi:hypothetical protein C5167_023326 [Papaver somniferum]|uniref:Uncharacterized protein n=1 Tax=Papaver somniferum TaxID=3469 RepID=A0A4Y7JKG6_PAPSO|nr:cyclin-dependent protein kinase inhibitor SMR6-like [Papaver somniferum]RZC61573.1 hypothetical protein C5167_023326 [Papaver somniferum]